MSEKLRKQVIDRYRSTGMLRDRGDHSVLLNPFVMDGGDIGLDYRSIPPRFSTVSVSRGEERRHENRLEELRTLAVLSGVPEERTTDESQFEKRLFTFTGSDESVDRYGCRVLVDGTFNGKRYGKGWQLDNYRRAPRFMPFHEYNSVPCGRSLDTWVEKRGEGAKQTKRLRFQVLMDDGPEHGGASAIAPLLTRAYRTRLMESVSVGWWPQELYCPETEEERDALGLGKGQMGMGGVLFSTNELWELSAVSIPGNPNAVMEGAPESVIRGYQRLADEAASIVPEFAYQIRSALPSARGTTIHIHDKGNEGGSDQGDNDCPSCGSDKLGCLDCGWLSGQGSGSGKEPDTDEHGEFVGGDKGHGMDEDDAQTDSTPNPGKPHGPRPDDDESEPDEEDQHPNDDDDRNGTEDELDKPKGPKSKPKSKNKNKKNPNSEGAEDGSGDDEEDRWLGEDKPDEDGGGGDSHNKHKDNSKGSGKDDGDDEEPDDDEDDDDKKGKGKSKKNPADKTIGADAGDSGGSGDPGDPDSDPDPADAPDHRAIPPDVSSKKAPESTPWSRPALKDFTSKKWGELSDSEKRHIAGHFAYSANLPPKTFGDMKLPHHRAKDGAVVWKGVANAMARLSSTQAPSSQKRGIYNHLARHYKQFGKTPPGFRSVDSGEFAAVFFGSGVDLRSIESQEERLHAMEDLLDRDQRMEDVLERLGNIESQLTRSPGSNSHNQDRELDEILRVADEVVLKSRGLLKQ